MKDTIWIKKGRFTPLALLLMLALPLVTSVVCLCFGRMNVPVGEVLTALRTALTGGSAANVPDALKVTVRFDANGHGTGRAAGGAGHTACATGHGGCRRPCVCGLAAGRPYLQGR